MDRPPAGKSTLARNLQGRPGFRLGSHFAARSVRTWPALVRNAGFVTGALLPRRSRGRRLTWEEIKKTVYLKEWPRQVARERGAASAALVLDQGPIFELARLMVFGPSWLPAGKFEAWWPRFYRSWASVLDVIVWLDAPDELLLARGLARQKLQPPAGDEARRARRSLTAYRSAFSTVVAAVPAEGQVEVLPFDTSRQSFEAIANQVAKSFERPPE